MNHEDAMERELFGGPPPRDPTQQCWDPDIQFMDPERLRALQDERVRAAVAEVLDRPVPLFRRMLESAGVTDPRDITGVEDLASIPTITKDDLRASEEQHPPVGDYRFFPLHDALRIGQSSGTTGKPTTILWTRRDIWVENETAARSWWRTGLRPGMVVTHAHPAYLYGGGITLTRAYEYFGVLCVWVPPPKTDEDAEVAFRIWQQIPPDRPFRGFAARRFREVALKKGLNPEHELPLSTPLTVSARPGGSPLTSAGGECFNFLGSPCAEGNGSHLAEDYAYVQALDPATGREVPDGDWGSFVITTFGRDSRLIRYELGEICRIDRSPCQCGETSARAWWGGRKEDLLPTPSGLVWINDIERVLDGIPELHTPELHFLAVRPVSTDQHLAIRVECPLGWEEEADRVVRDAFLRELGVDVVVEPLSPGSLERSAYKPTRVIDADPGTSPD